MFFCQENWKDLIPESEHVLEWAKCVAGEHLICGYMEACLYPNNPDTTPTKQ